MSSQKSTPRETAAVVPKRQRGRDRVEVIVQAAVALFAEKGYDAVTMTEVAARSSTAIGSLYRFFPTKESLAAAVLQRFGGRMTEALDDVVRIAEILPPPAVAEALVDLVQSLRQERSAALALIDVHSDSVALRQSVRGAMIDRLKAILARVGASPAEDHGPRATLLLHLLKTTWALKHDDPAMQEALNREARRLVRLYLEDARGDPTGHAPSR